MVTIPLLLLFAVVRSSQPKSKVAHLLNSELKQDRTWWWLCEFGFRLVMAGCIASWTRSSSMVSNRTAAIVLSLLVCMFSLSVCLSVLLV